MSKIIKFAEFELDLEQKQLSDTEHSVPLRPQTFAVLCVLIERAPAVVSRDELLDAVWGHQATSPSSVSQTIKELRAALGDSSSEPRLIATRRRLGYQFIADIQRADVGEEHSRSDQAPVSDTRDQRSGFSRVFLALAVVTLVVIGGVSWWLDNQPETQQTQPPRTLAVASVTEQAGSANPWFSTAMSLFLGHALSELDGIRVVSPGLMDQTSVDFLIDASHRHHDDGVDIMAVLRRPDEPTAEAEITNQYELADVGLISSEMADAIGDWLGVEPVPEVMPGAIRARLPQTVDAQKIYFEARAMLEQQRAMSAYDHLSTLDSDEPHLLHLTTQALAMQGNWLDARERMSRLLSLTELWPRRERLAIEATAARLDFNYELAADRLQALNQFYPEPGNVHRMIEAQIESGRLETAAEAMQLYRAQSPVPARIGILQARLAEADNQPAQQLDFAEQAFHQAVDAGLHELAAQALVLQVNALRKLGRIEDAVLAIQRMSELPASRDRLAQQAELQLVEANLRFQQGQLDQALSLAEQSQALFAELNAQGGQAESLIVQGIALERSGRLDDSLIRLNAAIEQFEALGDRRRQARAHVNLGITLMSNGQPESALENLDRAGQFYREINDRQGEAAALINQGTLLARTGQSDEAERVLERALEAFSDIGDLRGQAITLGNLAGLASRRGDIDRAIDLNTRALDAFAQIGAEIDAARTAYNLALVHRRLGNLAMAEQVIGDAAERFGAQGSVAFEARALVTQGSILLDRGRNAESLEVIERLATLAIENPARQAEIATLEGQLALAVDNPDQATEHFQRAHDLRTSAPEWQLMSELDLTRAALAQGRVVEAEQQARRLADLFEPDADVYPHIDALLLQAESLIEQNRMGEADGVLQRASEWLDTRPHAHKNLKLLLLRARISEPELAIQQLEWIVQSATEQGFEPLADLARARINSSGLSPNRLN